jgi:hypothetical protein
MRLASMRKSIVAALLVAAASSAFSQSAPSALGDQRHRVFLFGAGGGVATYDVDWGQGRMLGAAGWADLTLDEGPRFLRGLGFEGEARDIAWGQSPTQPQKLREETFGAGGIYIWRQFRIAHPYVKFIGSYGNVDFPNPSTYTHDSRTVSALGGGLEVRAFRNVWGRADYEYQLWPALFAGQKTLDPQGFTFGAMYEFGVGPRQ